MPNLATLVLPLAWLAFLVCALPGRSIREAAAWASLSFGVCVALFTELLSPWHAITLPALLSAWLAATFAAAAYAYQQWRQASKFHAQRPRWSGIDLALCMPVAVILLLVAVTAWLSPPNTYDAMAYHLPRVVYWHQSASVAFFATPFLSQIMLSPLAEYIMLHTYVLAGNDHFANFAQWFGFAMSTTGVSLIAKEFGAGARGQVVAAVFCATLPGAILQASGAKNDCVLSLWLVLAAYFALRYRAAPSHLHSLALGSAVGLALLTKGTAYLTVPPVLAAILLPLLWKRPRLMLRLALVLALCVLVLNGPHYLRNLELSGSPLGFDSSYPDVRFRWRNSRFGVGTTISNLLRHVSEQIGGRSQTWNTAVYNTVQKLHRKLDLDPRDPATTWQDSVYGPPKYTNHEADASNRLHVAVLLVTAIPLCLWVRDRTRWMWSLYAASLVLAFVLFCAYLRWQSYGARLQVPLFLLAAPLVGLVAGRLSPNLLAIPLCLFLLDGSRRPVLENWLRPLRGPRSIRHTPRDMQYFADMRQFSDLREYQTAIRQLQESGCRSIGIDSNEFPLEYPLQALLLEHDPRTRFVHVNVHNASRRYRRTSVEATCAEVCLRCKSPTAAASNATLYPVILP